MSNIPLYGRPCYGMHVALHDLYNIYFCFRVSDTIQLDRLGPAR